MSTTKEILFEAQDWTFKVPLYSDGDLQLFKLTQDAHFIPVLSNIDLAFPFNKGDTFAIVDKIPQEGVKPFSWNGSGYWITKKLPITIFTVTNIKTEENLDLDEVETVEELNELITLKSFHTDETCKLPQIQSNQFLLKLEPLIQNSILEI